MKKYNILYAACTALLCAASVNVFAAPVIGSGNPGASAAPGANAAAGAVITSPVQGTNAPSSASAAANVIDYSKAKPMPLPQSPIKPGSLLEALQLGSQAGAAAGAPGASKSSLGDGKTNPVILEIPSKSAAGSQAAPQGGVAPQAFGTSNHVYTTARSDPNGLSITRYFPFSPTGKLWFNRPGGQSWCSASLIKRGVIVTAAHCVAAFGQRRFYSNWQFAPGYDMGTAPYGTPVIGTNAVIMTSYYLGTDSCPAAAGVVCQNDVAVIRLSSNIGNNAGWYGYAYNGYGFNPTKQAQITQLGYPGNLDRGLLQERTDSQGFVSAAMTNNTVIGSAMQGGSSGGPWVVNFGIQPAGFPVSNASAPNTVVGVTSWGYTNPGVQQQGASPFLSTNIVPLVNAICSSYPGSC